MKTTREAELELLEIARDRAKKTGLNPRFKRRSAILERVYAQVKDSVLEKLRNELHHWIRLGLLNSPEKGMPPTRKQMEIMAQAEQNIERIEKAIKRYASNPGIQQQIVKKMYKHDPLYAQSIAIKQRRTYE